jgi:hypothetical protein
MAILKGLTGIRVTILSAGKKLDEHKKIEPRGAFCNRTVSKYIESTTDAEFSFKLRVSEGYQLDCPTLLFTIYVDGQSIGGRLCGAYEPIYGGWTKEIEGIKLPTDKRNVVDLRKFRFSELMAG